ncbi:MAG: hypothetical protein QOH99_260 [Frankiaceae bacterium]|nr:hypothetical protein [Frankiaceae bacterium]
MSGPRGIRAVVALLAAVGVVVGADHLLPAVAPAAALAQSTERRPLSAATLVCPDVAEDGAGPRSTKISFSSDSSGGTVTAHWLQSGAQETSYDGSSQVQTLPEQTHNFGGVVLTAAGNAAAGFTAGLTSRYDAGSTAGTAAVQCAAPTTNAYFVGPATTTGHDPRLVLVNPDPSPANVDVAIAEDGKPFSPESTRGIALPGYGTTTVALVDVAPEQAAVAIHVQTRSGRVTAVVRDRWYNGSLPLGVDWLSGGAAPGKDLVLPGIGGTDSNVTLVLASQSADAGTVVAEARNASGSFTPAGLQSIDVAAGAIVRVTVPKSALGSGGALHVTSDVPVLAAAASVRADTAKTPRPDFAWTPAGVPLTGPVSPPPGGTQMILTSATDTAVDFASPTMHLTLTVTAGTSVSVSMSVLGEGVLVVPKDPGVLYAAVVNAPIGSGGALAVSGLVTPARTIVVLPARPDIFLGSR